VASADSALREDEIPDLWVGCLLAGPANEMKVKAIVCVFGLAVVLTCFFCIYHSKMAEMTYLLVSFKNQSHMGASYMRSLEADDLQTWIGRTENIINSFAINGSAIELFSGDIPTELTELGIQRVDITTDSVRYVWLGGIDHTNLYISKVRDGTFEVVAHYNDKTPGVRLWPK
jgi:hypothetical protein